MPNQTTWPSIAIFISGNGSNMRVLLDRVQMQQLRAKVAFVFSNSLQAAGLLWAKEKGYLTYCLEAKKFSSVEDYESQQLEYLKRHKVEWIICAGYMRLIHKTLLDVFHNRIINIHPSLLPAFPGKNAPQQSIEYGVQYSGCTVHFIDHGIDTGPIITQRVVLILSDDTADSLHKRILAEEHFIFWRALQAVFQGYILQGRQVRLQLQDPFNLQNLTFF